MELRFIEREVDSDLEGNLKTIVKVLQFRRFGNIIGGMLGTNMGWSEWQDVPTVKE